MKRFWKKLATGGFAGALALVVAFAASAQAEDIAFTGWTHQKFSLFGGNSWHQSATELSVESQDSVSLVWRAVPESAWQTVIASWRWRVDEGVPPTDLSQKGGDDRNLALYFIFAPPEVAAAGESIRGLLTHPDVRVLMYVWGGQHARGDVVQSPYLEDRGRTIVLRPASVGQQDEKVDVRADLQQIYGRGNLALIGLAVSADSDDTHSAIRASIADLKLFAPS